MICNNCGYVNPDSNKYCAKCGKKFTRIQSELTDMNTEIPEIKETNTQRQKYHKETTADKIRNIPSSYKILSCILLLAVLILVGFATPENNNTVPIIEDINDSNIAYNDTDNTTQTIKSHINVTVNNNIKVYQKANITGYLSDENNKSLIDCEISVNIDGQEYKTHTDMNGYYQIEYNQTTAGNHKITVLYSGDENIEGSQNTTTLYVEYRKSNITLEIEDKLQDENKIILKGMLTDEENNPISNAQIIITTANGQQTISTANDGTYNLEIVNPEHKTQEITAKYEGDENTEGSQATVELKVEKEKTLIDAEIQEKSDENINVKGVLENSQKNPISNAHINIKTDNQQLTANTDENGEFDIELSDINTSNIILSYDGNDTTDSCEKTLEVKKEKIKTSITIESNDTPEKGDSVNITGELVDENNNPLEDAQIKINDGLHEYTAVTNESGQYTLVISNISNETCNIKAVYEGNDTYLNCYDNLIIILDTKDIEATDNNESNYH